MSGHDPHENVDIVEDMKLVHNVLRSKDLYIQWLERELEKTNKKLNDLKAKQRPTTPWANQTYQ